MTDRLSAEDERKAALARKVAPLLLALVEEHRHRQAQDEENAA